MKAKPTHNLTVATSKFTDREGNHRSRYKNIGMLFEREDGSQFLALDASVVAIELQWIVNPDHNDKVMAGLYPIEDRNDQSQRQPQEPRQQQATRREEPKNGQRGRTDLTPDLDDELPF